MILASSAPEAPAAVRAWQRIHVASQLDLLGMYLQNVDTSLQVWQLNRNTAVEPSRTEQRRVEGFRTVGRCQNDNALGAVEAVHLGQQLVQGLFPLVVAAAELSAVTLFTNGVDLVDKDDTRRFFVCLLEEVTHLGSAHTHEHFYELRTGDGEERHVCLAGDCLRQQGLTGTGRTYQQRTLWHGCADFLYSAPACGDSPRSPSAAPLPPLRRRHPET